jgi:hypothetical protein
VAAGFTGFAITWKADVFAGAPQASSADTFGTVGITFQARKAASEAERNDALVTSGRASPPPTADLEKGGVA